MLTNKKYINTFCVVSISICINGFIYAQESQIQLNKSEKTESIEQDQNYGLRTSLEFQGNSVMNDVGDVPGNKGFGELTLKYDSIPSQDSSIKKFDAVTRVNNAQQMMYSIKEAYVDFGNVVVGRHNLDWSTLDANWGLGKINNRVNMNYFEPGQEGLTGISAVARFGWFKLQGFASYVYVPEMNPGLTYDKDKGTVSCDNPWCDAPPSSETIDGKEIPIEYNINYPEIKDVVFRPSLGARFGVEADAIAVNAYYLVKPENQISTYAEAKYVNSKQKLVVDITPQFYYHTVFGGDAKLSFGNFKVYGSGIRIVPNEYPDGDYQYAIYKELKPQKKVEEYLGAGVGYESEKFVAKLNYIARTSDFNKEEDSLVELPRWNQAVQVQVGWSLTPKLSIDFDHKFDMLTEDRLSMFKASYMLTKSIQTSLGVNVIGSSEEDTYWSRYSNNDSFYGSLKYTF